MPHQEVVVSGGLMQDLTCLLPHLAQIAVSMEMPGALIASLCMAVQQNLRLDVPHLQLDWQVPTDGSSCQNAYYSTCRPAYGCSAPLTRTGVAQVGKEGP